jgi:nucleoid DNA-binding protein
MTKRDLVVRIAEETGIVQQNVLNVVQRTLDHISEAVATGGNRRITELRCLRGQSAEGAYRTQSQSPRN